MKISRSLLIAFAIGFVFQSVSFADEPPKLADIIEKCHKAIAGLEYVRYGVTGFILINGADVARLQLIWQEQGEKCRYDFIERDDLGAEHFKSAYSFDGIRSFRTFFGDGRYFARNGTWDIPHWVQTMEFITAPFEFMVRRKGVAAWQHPNIELLQSPAMWVWLAKNSAVIGRQKYRDRDCAVVQVNNTTDRNHPDVASHYIVYFDSGSGMPIAWKEFTQQDRLIAEFDVASEQAVHLGKDDLFIAPRQIKEVFHNFRDPADAPTTYWRFDFGDIVTNPELGESFSLDLTGAKSIYDDDLDTWISVPK